MNLFLKPFLAVFLVLGISSVGRAQSGNADSEISAFLGNFLPNQISGITEILPVFGGRYSFLNQSRTGALEFSLSNSHAEGVDYSQFGAALRADMPMIDQFMGSVYLGLNLSWYRPALETERKLDLGFQLGTAFSMRLNETVWLRTDVKFNGTPGTSLEILLGLVLR